MVLARQAVARHAMRRLLGDETNLNAVDAPSLFYLTWRWAYGHLPLPMDQVFKLERAFDVDIDTLARTDGLIQRAGSTVTLLGPQDRRDIELLSSPPMIDVLHMACRLWDAGRRNDLESLLAATGAAHEPAFWAAATALAEMLPEGDKERTMLLGLTGNRDRLAQAAGQRDPGFERMVLFENGQPAHVGRACMTLTPWLAVANYLPSANAWLLGGVGTIAGSRWVSFCTGRR
jgi:putative DNA methylase